MISRIINNFPDWIKSRASDPARTGQQLTEEIIEAYDESRINHPHQSLCNAPFSNMYFGYTGNVTACCYNRNHGLGAYPNQTIQEIWTGSKAEELRALLSKNDLSSGCDSCEKLILSRNFEAVIAKNYDLLPYSKDYPTKLEFELSNTCNLECTMCFGEFSSSIRKNREKKPPLLSPYDDAFVDQLEEFIPNLHSARFFGGEPFLIDIYYKIWDRIVELNPGCEIVVQTNATILNNKVKELLSKGKFKINISIDSLEKETYNSIRVNASFDKVMSNIEYFHQYSIKRGRTMGVSVCPMVNNWRELPEFIRFCNDMDAYVYFNTVWYPQELSLTALGTDSLNAIELYLHNFDFPDSSNIEKRNKKNYFDFAEQVKSWGQLAQSKEKEDRNKELEIIKRERKLEKRLQRIQSHHLKKIFFEKVENSMPKYIDLPEDERNKKLKEFLTKTDRVLKRFPEDIRFKKALDKLNNRASAEMVVKALDTETEDQLYNRVMALYNESL